MISTFFRFLENESSDFQYAESWYRFEKGEWYCVNTHNAWRVKNRGLESWYHCGKSLKRPMTDLVERETVTQNS